MFCIFIRKNKFLVALLYITLEVFFSQIYLQSLTNTNNV